MGRVSARAMQKLAQREVHREITNLEKSFRTKQQSIWAIAESLFQCQPWVVVFAVTCKELLQEYLILCFEVYDLQQADGR